MVRDHRGQEGVRPVEGTARLARFRFASGAEADVNVGYWTLGRLDARRRNAVLLCHGASGNRDWAKPFCVAGEAFDPARWFVISIDLPGGGSSSRSSRDTDFPAHYGVHDCTNAIVGLLDTLGVDRLAAFSGPSLASLVGLDLAASHLERVGAMALWNCGIRCDGFAQAAAEAVQSVLGLDGSARGMQAAVQAFLPALVGREYLAKASPAARDAMVSAMVSEWTAQWRGDELAARYACVASADLPAAFNGEASLAQALTCPILFLPSSSDAILPAQRIDAFAHRLPKARVATCRTDLGHLSTGAPPGSPEFRFFSDTTRDFLNELAG